MAWLALAMALPFAAARAQTFLPVPLNLSNTGHAVIPLMAVGPSGEIDAVWLDAGAILFRRSVDGGQTFSSTITVATTNLPSSGSQTAQPQIAVNSSGVYVTWGGVNAAGGGDIFFSSVASGGTSWLSPVNVSNGMGMAAGSSAPAPHMTVDSSGGVDIVWGQNGAYFARSTNGTSFSGAVQLTAAALASESPRMAVDQRGYVYAVWANADPTCPSMTFARSTNLGGSFQTYPVSDVLTVGGAQETGCASKVQITLGASNTIHLLWANDTPIQDLVTTYQADPGGSSFGGFGPPNGQSGEQGFQNLSSTSSFTPQMAIDANGNIDVAWIGDYQQNGGPHAIYFSRSTAGGATGSFSNQQPLTAPPVSGLPTGFAQIVVEPSGSKAIDVIWQQASAANPGGAYDILLARSTDGATFQKFTMDSAPTTAANTAQIAVDPKGNVYVVWLGNAGSGGDVLINGDSQGITTPPPFNLTQVSATVSPASATISVGGAASFAVSLQSTNPVPGSVTLACSGAPAGVSCAFTPASVSLSANGSGSAALNVSVSVKPAATAAQPRPAGRVGAGPVTGAQEAQMWAIGFLVFVMLLIVANHAARHEDSRIGRYARGLAWCLLLAAAVTAMVSCGGSTSSSGGNGGGGGGGGGGGSSVTFPLVVQGQANSSSTNLQTISITVP